MINGINIRYQSYETLNEKQIHYLIVEGSAN